MTPPTATETNLAWEGFFPVWMIVVLGIALLGVCVWSMRRDARVADRRWWGWGLGLLRGAAILVLLWILAGPVRVKVNRAYRTKSVAFLVDRSASMGLVDPADGSGNASRWSAARGVAGPHAAMLAQLDGGNASLRVALRQLERFGRLPDSGGGAEAARAALDRVVLGVEQGGSEIRAAIGRIPETAEVGKRALLDATTRLGEGLEPELRRRAAEFGRGKTLAALDRAAWLPAAIRGLAETSSRLERSTDQVAGALEPVAGTAGPVGAGPSRWAQVGEFMARSEEGWLGDLRRKTVMQRYEFGDQVVPVGPVKWSAAQPEAPRPAVTFSATTELGTALQEVALKKGAQALAAAVVFTDGGHNAGLDPREIAPSLAGTTLIFVPIGNTRRQRDVVLHHVHAPRAVLRQDRGAIDGIVTAYGCDQEKLRVELVDQGVVLDHQDIQVRGEVFDGRVQLRWKAVEIGKRRLELRVLPVADERTEANNASTADVLVMEDKLRVLVADHFPRWETRYLLNLFKRDERITFDPLLFEPQRTPGKGVLTSFPGTLEEWSKYRVVILGDVWASDFPRDRQELLRRYVTESGGNVILVAGRDAMPAGFVGQPLESLVPVEIGDRRPAENTPYFLHLADEGSGNLATQVAETQADSERVWSTMSQSLPIHGLSPWSRAKRSAHSLIWASPDRKAFNAADPAARSFLSWHYVGPGRVVYLAAPVTYQLRYRQGDTFHYRFWGQLLRWSAARDLSEGSQTVRLSTDKPGYETGDSVEAVVRLQHPDGRPVGGAKLAVTAFQEGIPAQEVALHEDPSRIGTYRGTLGALEVGRARLEVSGEAAKSLLAEEGFRRPVETSLTIDPRGELELRHPLCDRALLRETADAAGGVVVPATGLAAALRQLDLEPEVREETTKMPLWNRWDLFCLFIACLSLEWAGRKYVGLS